MENRINTDENEEKPEEHEGGTPFRWLAGALIISAFLRFLAHPPVQFEYSAWIAFIGYLFVFNRVDTWTELLLWTGVWAFAFYLPCLAWIRHISLLAWIGLSVIMVIFPITFAVLLWVVQPERGWRQVVLGAGAWVVGEYVQTHFLSGFPYLFLSHTQADLTPLIQVADVTGAWGVSALIFLVNGVLYLLLEDGVAFVNGRQSIDRLRRRWIGAAVVLTVLVGGTFGYGVWRLGQLSMSDGPDIGVIQGNIPLSLRGHRNSSQEIFDRHLRLARQLDDRTDLVIWPETMFPYPVIKRGERVQVTDPDKLQELAGAVSAYQILGVRTIRQPEGDRRDHNSAWLMNREGELEQHYAKYHLVPFGEYVPGQAWIPGFRSWIAGYFPVAEEIWLDAGSPPEESALMVWNGYKLAPMICYEVVFPDEFRSHVRKGADVVVNISNEAWYKNEAELDQMLSIVRFRSVEQRITVVRATNTGISGFVFPDGRARILTDEEGRDRGFSGGMVETVKMASGNTWYGQYGDWFVYLALIGLLCQSLWAGTGYSFKLTSG